MFAERYRLQFARLEDNRREDSPGAGTDIEDDSDEYENALEDVEIDQSSELYKTIVAAIIEDDQSLDTSMHDDAFETQEDKETTNTKVMEKKDKMDLIQSEVVTGNTSADIHSKVHVLLEEAADDITKR